MKKTKGTTIAMATAQGQLFCRLGHDITPASPNYSLQCSDPGGIEYWHIVCRKCNSEQAKAWRAKRKNKVGS